MPKFIKLMLLWGVVASCDAGSLAQQWASVKAPSPTSKSASIGSYTAGCLDGAVSLPLNGPGYQVMRLSRNRYYGHPNLRQFIEQLGLRVQNQQIGTVLIGDLGQARGGPTLSGHRSHQTGLDVDIWFLLSKQASTRLLSLNERETWGAPSVVADNGELDGRQWSASHEKMLAAAANMPEVERIFVNPSIKRALCRDKTPRAWLSKIRPWWKHDDHFHVRLKCPKDSPHCQGQEPLPAGDGCDAGLDWWFSAEAQHPAPAKTPPKPLVLPALCTQVLAK